MFTIQNGQPQYAFSRREFVRAGAGLAAIGGVLPAWLTGNAPQACAASDASTSHSKSCILVYLLGGPPHLDTFDLKPDAPAEIRGPFQPISTNIPGLQICEHLPLLAGMAQRYALVRSVSRPNSNHTPMIYYTLTGRDTQLPAQDNDTRPPQREDFPHIGGVISHLRPTASALPGYVAIPELAVRSSLSGEYKRVRTSLRGGHGGFLGSRFDPLSVQGEPGTPQSIPALALPDDVTAQRFAQRREILSLLDQGRLAGTNDGYHAVRKRALLLTGTANDSGSPLFSLAGETDRVRERYGRNRFGQALLLARRLTEAGVPLVAIHFNEMTICDGWDTHSKNFEALQAELLPYLDQGLSALLEDLDERGRLPETLVACFGEFGRTPKINANAGRDHWGDCSTTLLAGGGIRGGIVHGESDRQGAFPKSDRVDPADIQATLYHCLGLNPTQAMYDQLHRPHALSLGKVVRGIL